jgi:hypothetical protein
VIARWSIPGVGVLHPCIDRVVIVSPVPVGQLRSCLPISDLERASHAFDIITYRGSNPQLRSTLRLTGLQDAALWSILAKHERRLGRYSIVLVEGAFDVHAISVQVAQEHLDLLTGMLSKRKHQRGFLRCEHKPNHTPPPGLVSGPTYYFEDRKSGVNLKCYVRHEKLAGGKFGRPITRLEWTLTKKPALVRHLGGNQISDLLQADLNGFLQRNLRLERVDHSAVGKVLRGHPLTASSNSMRVGRAKAVAYFTLRRFAYREHQRGHFPSSDHALKVCQFSPAQIRGYLRELRAGKRRGRGRPKVTPRIQKRAITDYRIDACFKPVMLQRIRSPV